MKDPNFPDNLDIGPSTGSVSGHRIGFLYSSKFGHDAQEVAIRKYGIAGRVWEAAYILHQYIRPPSGWTYDPPFIHDQAWTLDEGNHKGFRIIELGSGVGLIGAAIADVMRPNLDLIIETDLPNVCPLLEDNLHLHPNRCVIAVRPLSWGNEWHATAIANEFFHTSSPPLTHIVCSDLVYFPELLAPLLRTLIHLTSTTYSQPSIHTTPQVIICYKIRSLAKETPFWSAFGLYFIFRPVLVQTDPHEPTWERAGGESADDATFLFVAERRPESQLWWIPEDDDELLRGVGAWGTDAPKGDDTFESLLFLSLGP
ncbi:hypothetical protein AX16_006737 [Volvariella volvacea WC 439]|nr:hypothetical protein AX16_006737 [Volvariella volvacea WC 439]